MRASEAEALVGCILSALHNKVCRIVRYGGDGDVAVLTPYKISEDEEARLSDAVVRFNQRCRTRWSVVDLDEPSYLQGKDSLPFYREIERTGVLLWPAEEN